MNIRAVEEHDFAQWFELWEGYNRFYKRTIAVEVSESTWRRCLDLNESVHALVAEKDGQLLGFTLYLFHRHTGLIENVCYLQDLFTLNSARGQGVGTALIQAVYAAAKSKGSNRVYWMTHESNTTARSLYNKVARDTGFIIYGKTL